VTSVDRIAYPRSGRVVPGPFLGVPDPCIHVGQASQRGDLLFRQRGPAWRYRPPVLRARAAIRVSAIGSNVSAGPACT